MATTHEDEIIDTPEIIEPEDDGNTPDPIAEDDGNTPAESTQDEQPPAEDKPAAGGHIPKARFNEVISQREALKEQLAERDRQLEELQRQGAAPATQQAPAAQAQPAAPEFKELSVQYHNALTEGDMDKAEELNAQIHELVLQQATERVMQRQAQQRAQQQEQQDAVDLQAEAASAIEEFPYLDTVEGANARELILLSRDHKAAAGMPIAQALREAVASIAPRFAPADTNPAQGLQNSAKKVDNRTSNAIARGAADSIKQPPAAQAGVGNRATAGRVDIASMTDEQIKAIPKEEMDRLLGNA